MNEFIYNVSGERTLSNSGGLVTSARWMCLYANDAAPDALDQWFPKLRWGP